MDLGKNKKFNSGCFSVVLGVVIISKKDDYGGRWQEKKKKKSVLEEESTCCSSFTSDFHLYAFYRTYSRVLLLAESKENVYSEYVDFFIMIIVENYGIFLIVSLLVKCYYKFFLNYLIIEYSA